jgi:hypothetical protein
MSRDKRFLDVIVSILERGLSTNSYKFALLRALADYGRGDAESDVVCFSWLAERFLSYYRPLTVAFRVRQVPTHLDIANYWNE